MGMDLKNLDGASTKALTKVIEELIKKHTGAVSPEDLPIIKVVKGLLDLGHSSSASDIHIEPYEEATIVRFRIDGILHDIFELPPSFHSLIVTRIKILSRLRTDEHQAPQDGKLRFKPVKDEASVDVRVSVVPVVHGEKVVMRLLSEKSRQYDLENLGFCGTDSEKIDRAMSRPWGMILSTGPTGCGKTTTLYSILKKLNRREVNISTIEDPVEYDMAGVNQIQVNSKTELTFSSGLRSIVRQDPDIIMVGEVRDEETAKIAVNSAMTGHLVLSTIHTNDAATTLPRFIDMGVQPFLVASTINLAVAQRLVRRTCPECKEDRPMDDTVREALKRQLSPEIITKYELLKKGKTMGFGKGCEACHQSGYKGRMIIAEVLEVTDEIREMIMHEANSSQITQKAMELGMVPIIEDGMNKVASGLTTIDEILRVVQE